MADFFSTLFGGGAEKEAAQKDIAAAQMYQGQALPALQQGYQTGTGAIGTAIQGYQPLVNLGAQYNQVAPTITGALGIGTPQQISAARSAFSNDPGYQFALQQAQQGAERAAAAGGMTASGNLIDAEQQNAINLQNQQYQNWLKNLMNVGQMGANTALVGAQGQAQGQYNLANLAQQYGQNQAGVYGNVAQTDIGANNLQAAGEAAGAKNLLGAGLSLATLAMGGMGGGGMGSMLGGLFGGGGQSGALNIGGYAMPTVGYNPMRA